MAGVIGCGLFGAISGSTVATVVALGGFMIPALKENGYNEKFTLGIMTTSPNLGVIVPPSISMILYSMISNVSLEGLFLTGFFPAFLIIIGFCAYSFFISRKDPNIVRLPPPDAKQAWQIVKEGIWSILLPIIIFGGIFSGVFTANEAAVVACVYAFFIEMFVHKAINFRDVKKICTDSAVTSASLLLIVAGAICFGRYLTLEAIPVKIADFVMAGIQSPLMFLVLINAFLIIVGMFIDIISATLILVPVFLPMLDTFGIDPMHFGLIFTVNLAIAYCTPPMGVSLYIVGALGKRDLLYVSKAVMPFLAIQYAVLAIVTYKADWVLWFPKMLGFI
jgi:C4-dicarboxylate transporter DctM subunit